MGGLFGGGSKQGGSSADAFARAGGYQREQGEGFGRRGRRQPHIREGTETPGLREHDAQRRFFRFCGRFVRGFGQEAEAR